MTKIMSKIYFMLSLPILEPAIGLEPMTC